MAICSTIRTKYGTSKFLLPSENGDELVSAFRYENGKIEVHSLKKECSPLYLEEETTINLLSNDTFGNLLIAVTASCSTNCLEFRLWDIGSPQGFVPKDIHLKVEHKKEGKFHCTYDVQKVLKEELHEHIVASYGSLLALVLNGKFCILMKARKNDMGIISFDVRTQFSLTDASPTVDILFLSDHQNTYLSLAEGSNVRILNVGEEQMTPCCVFLVPMKRSKATTISSLLKLTSSKCLVIDDYGHLYLLSAPDFIVSLKFPGSIGHHDVCAVVSFGHSSEGILAICNNDHTINLYSLADVIESVLNGIASYVKPYRVLCSQFPINSMSFIRSDQLALASSVNQSITFWGGFSTS